MLTRKWVVCVKRVIELRIKPVGGGMTSTAVARQAKFYVRGVVAIGKVIGVAGETACRGRLEHIVEMAGSARQCCMCSRERVTGVFQVVELGVEPTVHCVAGFARGGELTSNVIDYGSQKILLMAGVTRS